MPKGDRGRGRPAGAALLGPGHGGLPITVTPEPTTTAPPQAGSAPRLAEGVELIGEYEGSGYKEAPSIARRGDGQVVQLTNLLYLVAKHADGQSDYDAIAAKVSDELGRRLTGDNVRFLVEEKLHPLGLVTGPSGEQPQVQKADPLLALRFRTAVIPERAANVVARLFTPLFFPPVVVVALAAFVAFDLWLFLHHGVAQGVRETLYEPQFILAMFGLVVLSAAFHETGHAAGCAYGGAKPGKMGCGIYLAWPAFYTDVTDAYRLGRAARLRTDLGGVYFNMLFCLGTAGVYALTHSEWLLLVVVVQHFEMVHQLLPVVRLDGYYIVADLTGVPDLFNRIKPILVSMLPWRRADERVTVLKRWVRAAVTLWVLLVVPLLLFQLLMLLIHLPRIFGTAFDSLGKQWTTMGDAFADGNAWSVLAGIVQILALSLPLAGIVLMLWRIGSKVTTGMWRRTDGKPVQRGLSLVAGAAVLGLLAMAWVPKHNYHPIRPGERGTLSDGVAAVRELPSGRGPLISEERAGTTSDEDDPLGTEPADAETETSSTTSSSTTTTLVRSTATTTATTIRSTTTSSTTTTLDPSDSTTTTAP